MYIYIFHRFDFKTINPFNKKINNCKAVAYKSMLYKENGKKNTYKWMRKNPLIN